MSEPALHRCTEHGLAFDPSLTSGCVLCRRSTHPAAEPRSPSGALRLVAVGLVLTGVVALGAYAWNAGGVQLSSKPTAPAASEPAPSRESPTESAPAALPPREGTLATRNDSGRSGAFLLPRRSPGTPVPLLVALHGQGGEGSHVVGSFRALALSRGFAILAPSSNHVAEARSYTWRVGDRPNDFSPDYRHVAACLEELLARTDVAIDRERVLAAGFSGGASSAPYLATNTEPYEAFAVLHGGVFPGGLGSRRVRGWVSTGQADPARPPDHVAGHVRSLQAAGLRVEFRVYPGGHGLSRAETTELVDWWLGAVPLPR